ncbi:MAG TPA: class I SAM-dependent methyltransferase [Gaiellaceae bacterium]|nr:class I SAM-dependent methyltransferase [Gaiellaceae bacterium]
MTGADAGRLFDAQGEWYDRQYDAWSASGRVLRARLQAVLDLLGEGQGDVLDAGMGSGRLCAELDRRGWTVTGIDASARMVELARSRLPHLAARLRQARLESLPFADRSFDAVVATGVLEYVDDLGRGLGELARVLRPSGSAVLSFPDYWTPHNLWRLRVVYPLVRTAKAVVPVGRPAPPPRRRLLVLRRFEEELEAAGLTVAASVPIGARPAPGRLRTRQVVYATRKRP